MKRSNAYLSTCIAIAICPAVYGQEPPPDSADLPPVAVIGTPLDPIPVPVGPNPGYDANYWWRQSQQPGSGGDPGYVTPSLPSPAPAPMSPYCALMAAQGFPEGCTRQYLQAGPPQINGFENPWQLDHLSGHALNRGLLSMYFNYSLAALRSCYSDIANDPSSCEADYDATIRSTCNLHAYAIPTARNDMTDRELCNLGADDISNRMDNVSANRVPGFWYRYFEDNQLGVIRAFYVVVDLVTPFLPSDQYNALLVDARRYANCAMIINTWDAQGCSATLPG